MQWPVRASSPPATGCAFTADSLECNDGNAWTTARDGLDACAGESPWLDPDPGRFGVSGLQDFATAQRQDDRYYSGNEIVDIYRVSC
jgi:hypothetical protein